MTPSIKRERISSCIPVAKELKVQLVALFARWSVRLHDSMVRLGVADAFSLSNK